MPEGDAELTERIEVAPDRIEDLYVRHGPAAFRLAFLLTGDARAAEDAVQDAFVQVIGRLGNLRTGLAFEAYLRTTVINIVRSRWRRAAIMRKYRVFEEASAAAIPASDSAIVDRLMVWNAIQQLPPRQRVAIVLRFYEDLAEDDIASIMRCRPGTARSLISRGMAALREGIGGGEDRDATS
jgi:RNA polymerase sigma-70 factor (sigma-E family)